MIEEGCALANGDALLECLEGLKHAPAPEPEANADKAAVPMTLELESKFRVLR